MAEVAEMVAAKVKVIEVSVRGDMGEEGLVVLPWDLMVWRS